MIASGIHRIEMKIVSHWLRPRSLSIRSGSPALLQGLRCGMPPSMRAGVVAALAAGLALAGCSGSMPLNSSSSSHTAAEGLLGLNGAAASSGQGRRELTLPEKKIISDAVGLSIRDPGSAQFRWPTIPASEEGQVNYCGMVNAKSPYPAYNGWQAYIIEAQVTAGKVSSAVVGLIAGGKDTEIVRKMCRKYDLDPGGAG
jgi:hypothetical protein